MQENTQQSALPAAAEQKENAVALIRDGLMTLQEAELRELDAIITPRAADLLVKAFGEEMRAILAPLVENDADNTAAPPQADESALRNLIASPEYWREQRPQTVRKVMEGFRTLYGGGG